MAKDFTDKSLSEVKAELFRALAHPARVRSLELLVETEMSVGELAGSVGIEPAHLSQQLAVLRRAGIVRTRREGTTVFYSAFDPSVATMLAACKQVLLARLADTEGILTDLRSEDDLRGATTDGPEVRRT